jgi:tRNA (cytosine49-C5)-methyltransferase
MEFKAKFIERYSGLTDFEKYKEACGVRRDKSIRVNTLKISVSSFVSRMKSLKLRKVPWCSEGFFVGGERTDLGNLAEHGLGYFYVQEASSMVPVEILKPKPGDFVLDMAAAPGSKTTQIASKLKNKGFLMANDVNYNRMKALTMNMQRCGVINYISTLKEGRFFRGFSFDKILLDAPCSGTGTLSKSPRTALEWNPHGIRRLAGIQKQLIKAAFENLAEGGSMVYSTCTLEPEEDEGVVSYLLDNFSNAKVSKVKLDGLKTSKAVTSFNGKEFDPSVKNCLRIWPQDNKTDGFFVAKIKKI